MVMQLSPRGSAALWREDSAVADIIAGEVAIQHDHPLAGDIPSLIRLASRRAVEATRLDDVGELDDAGHALIGCAVGLALAAIAETPEARTLEGATADLASSLPWHTSEPTPALLAELTDELARLADQDEGERRANLWDLTMRAGGYATGMSQHITRRRQRRDLIENGD
jgi:hypothetical protein